MNVETVNILTTVKGLITLTTKNIVRRKWRMKMVTEPCKEYKIVNHIDKCLDITDNKKAVTCPYCDGIHLEYRPPTKDLSEDMTRLLNDLDN